MKSLKKFFALCLTLALVLSLAACAQKPAETTDPAETCLLYTSPSPRDCS